MRDPGRRQRAIVINLTALIVGGSLCLYLGWALRSLILPIVLGVLLAYLFRPLKSAFKYHWLSESMRLAIVFSLLLSGLLIGIKFVKSNIPDEKERLEVQVRLKYKLNHKFNQLMEINPKTGKGNAIYNVVAQDVTPIMKSLNAFLSLSPEQKELFEKYHDGYNDLAPVSETYYGYFLENEKSQKRITERGAASELNGSSETATVKKENDQSFLLSVMDIISIWLVMPFVFVFFLIDEQNIMQFFIGLVPNRYFELTLTLQEKVDEAIGGYLRGISLECLLVAISMAIGLYLMGLPLNMSLLISLLSGIATAIPFLGPVVGVGFGLVYVLIAEELHPLLPFITMDNSPLMVIAVNLIVLALDNLVFQPIVLGGAVNLHPLVIIIGLTAGSMLFGLAGVLLAIPGIVVAKVLIHHTYRGLKDYRVI